MRPAAALAIFLAASCLPAGTVLAQPQPAVPAQAPPGFAAAQAAFLRLSPEERRDIQLALVWTGHFAGMATGDFGRLTFGGLQRFQADSGMAQPNAILTAPQRAALLRAANEARRAARFEAVPDPRTGVAVTLPLALLDVPRRDGPSGSRWAARNDLMIVETLANPRGDTDLAAIHARLTEAAPGRRITYQLLRPDFAVVSGEAGNDRAFYVRIVRRGDDAVGVSISWRRDQPNLERVVFAIVNAFEPGTRPAASPGGVAERPPAPPVMPQAPPRAAAPDGSAIVLARGVAITAGSVVERCQSVTIGDGVPVRVTPHAASGTAILAFDGDRIRAAPVAVSRVALATDARLVAIGRAAGEIAVAVAPAVRDGAGRLVPDVALQPGQTGAALFGPNGGLAGVLLGIERQRIVAVGQVALAVPQRVAETATLPLPADVTAAETPARPLTAAEIARRNAAAILPVSCRR